MSLNGPEDVPLMGYVKEHKLLILIHDLTKNEIIRKEIINYSDPKHKQWLGRVTFWATTNGYSITSISEKDIDKLPK